MNDKLLMVLVLLFFSIVFLSNVFASNRQKKRINSRVNSHNYNLIFREIPSSIRDECYQADSFFKMHNTGMEPCEYTGKIEYIRYSEKTDYWIERKI